ncbi:hypothetical protein C5167_009832, partial [Papaver somniferum]
VEPENSKCTTEAGAFKSNKTGLEENLSTPENVQEPDELTTEMEAPQEEDEESPPKVTPLQRSHSGDECKLEGHRMKEDMSKEESGGSNKTVPPLEQTDNGDNCQEHVDNDASESEFWRRTPIVKGTPEEELDGNKKKNVKVSSFVRNVKERKKRMTRCVGEYFIADRIGRKRMSKTQRVDPNKKYEEYKDFDTLKLICSMEDDDDDDDKRKLKIFFERTRQSECAWRLINGTGEGILVLGSHVQDLVDYGFLEAELLQYYMYKLETKQKDEESRIVDSHDVEVTCI